MPKLSEQLKAKEIILPESQAKCVIGLSYGDKLKLQSLFMDGMKFKIGGKNDEQMPETEVGGDLFQKETELMITLGLKSWDMQLEDGVIAPISWENISLLSDADGKFLREEIGKLSSPKIPSEVKKK